MLKKVFWIAVAICVILLVLINSHEVQFFYLHGKNISLKLDLILIVAFVAGILSVLISGFIGTSERFFSDLTSYSKNKKAKKIKETFDEAVNCIRAEDYRKAKTLLNSYLKEEISNIDAYIHLSDIYLYEANLEDARAVLKKAAVVSRNDVDILNRLSEIYVLSDKPDKALKLLEEIKDKVEDKALYNKKIFWIYLDLNEYKKAYEIQQELEKDGSYDEELKEEFLITRYRFAQALIEEGRAKEAENILKSVLKDDNRFYGAYIDYAALLAGEDRVDEAVDLLTAAYQKTRFSFLAKSVENIFLAREDPQKALSFYQDQIDQNASDSKASWYTVLYALYINLLLNLEMIDFAIDVIDNVIGSHGEKKLFHLFLAECYFRHKKYEASAKEYHKYAESQSMRNLAFTCGECGAGQSDFSVSCDCCGSYNTIDYFIS